MWRRGNLPEYRKVERETANFFFFSIVTGKRDLIAICIDILRKYRTTERIQMNRSQKYFFFFLVSHPTQSRLLNIATIFLLLNAVRKKKRKMELTRSQINEPARFNIFPRHILRQNDWSDTIFFRRSFIYFFAVGIIVRDQEICHNERNKNSVNLIIITISS